ncbi:MAG TPA: MFS transporter, partial [Flavisolibacter sp.]
IVFSQFAGTSLWFAGNAILGEIGRREPGAVGGITSLVQLGFISGTLVFAILTIADRFKPTLVFFMSSIIAAAANVAVILVPDDMQSISVLRFITGFFLAGIYPVGMKIAADLFPRQTGNALGYLVGALVLGTAFPHLLRSQVYHLPWKEVLLVTSALAITGGVLMLLLLPSKASLERKKFEPAAFLLAFRSPAFRSAAFGYFGHMWELYTMWAFIPLVLQQYNSMNSDALNIPLWSFLVIAAGAVGCIAGGHLSKKFGSKNIALISLLVSGSCCLLAVLAFAWPATIFLVFLLLWGTTVVSDSPQFSTLVAQTAVAAYKGTALTIVTSIGFAITIVSIQLMQQLFKSSPSNLWLLAFGPLFGVAALLFGSQFSVRGSRS